MTIALCRPFLLFRLLALMAISALLLGQFEFATAAPFEPFNSPSSPIAAIFPPAIRHRRSLSASAANLHERGAEPAFDSLPIQVYALQRRSFPAYANRRSAHPCRWKLCGAYHNYNSLGRFF